MRMRSAPLTEAADEMEDSLRQPRSAVDAVKSTAQDAAANVQDEAGVSRDVKVGVAQQELRGGSCRSGRPSPG
jgi:hypothetical protein